MKPKRLVFDALLAAVALTLFIVELQIPAPVPIPGVKLGLANIVTVMALFLLTPLDAFAILCVRILLGSFFAGNFMALLYSAVGGALCFAVMLGMRKIVSARQVWVCSVVGAIAHNVGQMAVALAVTQTKELIVYLPVLLVSGILAGLFTGLAAQFLIDRTKPILPKLTGETKHGTSEKMCERHDTER